MSSITLFLKKPRYISIIRGISSLIFLVAMLVLVAWIFRSQLILDQYGDELILTFIVLIAINQFLGIDLRNVSRLILSFISKLGNVAIILSIVFFLLSFLNLPAHFTSLILPLILAGAILKLSSSFVAFHGDKISLKKTVERVQPFELKLGKFSIISSTIADIVRIKRSGRDYGVLFNTDLEVKIDTPIREIKINLNKPILLVSPHLKIKSEKEESLKKLPKDFADLLEKVSLKKSTFVKIPFIEVYEDMFSEHAKVGPINVVEDAFGEEVKIGPFFIKGETYKAKPLLYLVSNSPRFEAKVGLNYLKSKWDSQRLYLDEKRMILIRNSEKLIMEADSVKIILRDYELRLHPKTVYMYSTNFRLIVQESKIKFYSEKKTSYLENEGLAKELIKALNEEVSKQIKDFLVGFPFDPLALMYTVQEVIENYGGA